MFETKDGKFTVDPEIARQIAGDDHEDFTSIEERIIGTGRWDINYEVVVLHCSTNRYFRSYYSIGATELQNQEAYQYDEPVFHQVWPKEKIITIYE